MVKFPPLFPSLRWWVDFIDAYGSGSLFQEAIIKANASNINPKEFGRFLLQDLNGSPLMLSLAIEGGAKQLRNIQNSNNQRELFRLSEHGDWRNNHLRAINAILGKKPFFRDIEPRIKEVYINREIQGLEDFNFAIFKILFSFLLEGITREELLKVNTNQVLAQRGREIALEIEKVYKGNKEISLLQGVVTFGKETLLGILNKEYWL